MPKSPIEQLERDYAKADAEHTANCDKVQQSANKREVARKALEEARETPTEDVPAPEQVEVVSE